jgi:hypothetical protein
MVPLGDYRIWSDLVRKICMMFVKIKNCKSDYLSYIDMKMYIWFLSHLQRIFFFCVVWKITWHVSPNRYIR